jgi:hypothetical protein
MRPHPADRPRADSEHLGPLARLKRAGLLAAMTATAVNVWTGSPLAALWVGSRVQGSAQQPTMAPVFVVAGCIGVFSYGLLRVLRRLGSAYDRATGRPPTIRQHVPWLRSLRGERPQEAGPEYSLSALDIIMCLSVIILIALFEYWFFFLSTSSIDQRSGRG